MLHFVHVYNVAIPSAFSLVTVLVSTIEYEEAHFALAINSSVFTTVTKNNLHLSGGDGLRQCEIDGPTSQPRNVNCPNLSEGTSYNLTVDLSFDGNCLMIIIGFRTLSMTSPPTGGSTGMLPV